MTDDARIARLTELARKVWPEGEKLAAWSLGDFSAAQVEDDGLEYIHVHPHPRALDALEAALCVLAGEPPPQLVSFVARVEALVNEHADGWSTGGQAFDELLAAAKGKP